MNRDDDCSFEFWLKLGAAKKKVSPFVEVELNLIVDRGLKAREKYLNRSWTI